MATLMGMAFLSLCLLHNIASVKEPSNMEHILHAYISLSSEVEADREQRGVKRVRHAEKNRESSCAFADLVSSTTIDLHRQLSNKVDMHHAQTVLAAIILCLSRREEDSVVIEDDRLIIAGIGVGTKVLSAEVIEEERRNGREGDRRIRDMHAEVLARRGFRRFLLEEISRLHTSSSSVLTIDEVTGKYLLRDGITVHLYTSSQPCGNACIKRWGKSKKVKQYSDLSPMEYPKDEEFEEDVMANNQKTVREVKHPVYHPTARKEGEIALLAKRNRTTHSMQTSDGNAAEVEKPQLFSDDANLLLDPITSYIHPIGTIPIVPGFNRGNVMSCSDKIARWNILGLQGSILSLSIPTPIYLRTIIVGRKFSEIHCRRALCCRFSSKYDLIRYCQKCTQIGANINGERLTKLYRASHATMLCTANKLDDSIYCTDKTDEQKADQDPTQQSGANFSDFRCMVAWWKGSIVGEVGHVDDYEYEVLDGHTGLAIQVSYEDILPWTDSAVSIDGTTDSVSSISRVSSYSLRRFSIESLKLGRGDVCYEDLKKTAVDYQTVKQYILSDSTHLLGNWINK